MRFETLIIKNNYFTHPYFLTLGIPGLAGHTLLSSLSSNLFDV